MQLGSRKYIFFWDNLFLQEVKTFADASNNCRRSGGDLVEIRDMRENIGKLYKNKLQAFLKNVLINEKLQSG